MDCKELLNKSKFRVLSTTSEIVENLSNNQFYAYKICQAVISGVVDKDLKQLKMGGLLVVVVDYLTPSKGWGHGRRPWSPRSRATPQVLDQRS